MDRVDHILSSQQNYDEILSLIEELPINANNTELIHDHTNALSQIFGKLARSDQLATSQSTEKSRKISEWLRSQLQDYKSALLQLLQSEKVQISQIAFEACLKVILIEGKYLKQQYDDFIVDMVKSQLEIDNGAFQECWGNYLEYDDLRYYFFRAVASVLDNITNKTAAKNGLLNLFLEFENYPEEDEDIETFYAGKPKVTKSMITGGKGNILKVSSHKSSAQKAWLAFLSLPLTMSDIKQVLSILHVRVIPNIAKPQMLMDFLTEAYDHGGTIALLVLNSIFEMIQHYNLDYPHFFTKLYSLLEDGSLFASTHRARFLRLLDLFLTSTHLPSAIPASIIKRMARLALFSPPGAIVAILPFIYNQLKRHPVCMVMIHRTGGFDSDPFVATEKDPLLTNAIDSSLWEVEELTHHYQPNVAALARIFSQPFRKPHYEIEHFLVHSYETLYNTERKRKGNGVPALDYESSKCFEEGEFMGTFTI